jgi:hypothetical protein
MPVSNTEIGLVERAFARMLDEEEEYGSNISDLFDYLDLEFNSNNVILIQGALEILAKSGLLGKIKIYFDEKEIDTFYFVPETDEIKH